jgi:hypothetical protein
MTHRLTKHRAKKWKEKKRTVVDSTSDDTRECEQGIEYAVSGITERNILGPSGPYSNRKRKGGQMIYI